METYQKMLNDLQNALPVIRFDDSDFFKRMERIIHRTIQTLEMMRTEVNNRGFENRKSEITFFKTIKPAVTATLVFCHRLTRIKKMEPVGTSKTIRQFWKNQILELSAYFIQHKEFYEYWKSRQTHRDEEYFLPSERTILWESEFLIPQGDTRFYTSHDLILGKIMGILKTINFLKEQIEKNGLKPKTSGSGLRWTGSKVDLVELIYALHVSGALNNGEVNMSDLAQTLQEVFRIELGDIYRTFIEIRERKTAPTKFINTLKTRLIEKMNSADA